MDNPNWKRETTAERREAKPAPEYRQNVYFRSNEVKKLDRKAHIKARVKFRRKRDD